MSPEMKNEKIAALIKQYHWTKTFDLQRIIEKAGKAGAKTPKALAAKAVLERRHSTLAKANKARGKGRGPGRPKGSSSKAGDKQASPELMQAILASNQPGTKVTAQDALAMITNCIGNLTSCIQSGLISDGGLQLAHQELCYLKGQKRALEKFAIKF